MEHTLKTIGEVEDIAPGKRKRMSFKLTPGHTSFRITRSLIRPSPERGAALSWRASCERHPSHTLATCRERVRDDTRSLK